MTQQNIRNLMDVIVYLKEYAIKSFGKQPLAIGVTHDAYEKICEECCASERIGIHNLDIHGVRVVPV